MIFSLFAGKISHRIFDVINLQPKLNKQKPHQKILTDYLKRTRAALTQVTKEKNLLSSLNANRYFMLLKNEIRLKLIKLKTQL